jgi:hypothetical protein
VSAGPDAAVRQCGVEPPAFRFKGDHQGLFLEFDTNKLFGNTAPILASPASRHVRSNDRTNCDRFVEAKFKYLKEHNWFQRMSTIKQTPQQDHKNAESLDRDWLREYTYNQFFTNPVQSPDLLLQRATADAQPWNDLLSSSGGALEIPKCVCHLAHYGFTEAGCPVLQPSPVDKPQIQIQKARATSSHSFQCLSPYAARKTLGCFKSPSSDFKQSLQRIQAIAMEKSKFASSLRGCKIRLPVLLLHLPPKRHIFLPYQHHSGRASNRRTKRIFPPHLVQNGARPEYPPCHLV